MLVRGLHRPASLAMLAGGSRCAVATGQVEVWLRGIWTFDMTALAACAGAILARVAAPGIEACRSCMARRGSGEAGTFGHSGVMTA